MHPEFLAGQKLPPKLVTKHIWKERFEDINAFERYLVAQRLRHPQVLPARLEEGAEAALPRAAGRCRRRTGSSPLADVKERGHWDDYMEAYEDTIRRTATPEAPWFVVPADNKWFARLVVGAAVISALRELESQVSGGGQGEEEGPRGARGSRSRARMANGPRPRRTTATPMTDRRWPSRSQRPWASACWRRLPTSGGTR